MAATSVGSAVGDRVVLGTMVGILVSPWFVVGIPRVVISVRGIGAVGVVAGIDAYGNVWSVHPAATTAAIQRKKRTVPERSVILF